MKQPKTYPNDELAEPEDELTVLRRENNNFKNDPTWGLFFAMRRKSNEISIALNETEIRFDTDDKVFDKFIKLVDKLDPMVILLEKMQNQYLKLPDEELDAASKKPIPNILEQHANKKK